MHPEISLIVPCLNEVGNVAALHRAATSVFDAAGVALELVFVDDGSRDGTWEAIRAVADGDRDHAVRAVRFSRNFGKEAAMVAGMREATAPVLGIIDADLQQDPALALSMFRMLADDPDLDVVAAYQEGRREGPLVAAAKRGFYRLFNAAADEIDIPVDASDFRVFRRPVAEALLSLPERLRFSKGLFAWVGFTCRTVPYTARERERGASAWTLASLVRYAMTGILSFTTWPLRVAKWIGLTAAVGALLYLLYVLIVDYLLFGISIPGYPTLVCLILLIGGIQMLMLGVIGEYLGRDYLENKRRPLYIARERLANDGEVSDGGR